MIKRNIFRGGVIVFSSIMLIAYILILLKDFIPHAHPIEFPINSFWLGFASIIFGGVICKLYPVGRYNNVFSNQWRRLLFITCVTFFVQVYIFYEIYFIVNADMEVIVNCAKQVYTKPKEWYDNIGWYNDYFSYYPHNLAIMIFYSYIMKIEQVIGFLDVENGYMMITFIHCFISNISAVFLFKLVQRMTKSNIIAWCSYGCYVVLVLLSPWLAVPYADQVCLAFPIMTLYSYDNVNRKIHTELSVAGLVCLSLLSFILKPLAGIVGIAIFMIEIINLISKFSIKRFGVLICILVMILLGIQGKGIIVSKWTLNNGLNIDKERTLGVSHFFMMGLNEENSGAYCEEDVKYSKSFTTNKGRNAACLAVAKERIEEMGIGDMLEHSSKKLISSLADSSFGYKVLHLGRVKDVSDKGKSSLVLRSWLRSDGKYYTILSMFRQVIWGIVLFLSLGNWMSIFVKSEDQSNEEFAMELTIIGFLLFEVLFESNCRHILSMVSVFILSGAVGFHKICVNNKTNCSCYILRQFLIRHL